MLIDYEHYLSGEEWPSESKTYSGDGESVKKVWVGDMPPQYAANALAKLIRWARDSALAEQDVARAEDAVRSSRLGQLLAARALSIDDFTITEYVMSHGGLDRSYDYLDAKESARTLAVGMLLTSTPMEPEDIGRLAAYLVQWLASDQGLALAKVVS